VTYLIVGIDRRTLVPWHRNVRGNDPASARSAALQRAAADGVELIVAAVIGPNATVLDHAVPATAPLRAA
jgi:predicted Fe-Mo cluster-binding NifX family protein